MLSEDDEDNDEEDVKEMYEDDWYLVFFWQYDVTRTRTGTTKTRTKIRRRRTCKRLIDTSPCRVNMMQREREQQRHR